jgi:hypothetical protein
MSKVATSVKVERAQLGVIKRAAELAHEDYTEFMTNSAMLRIEMHLLEKKPQSPLDAYAKLHFAPYDASKVSPSVAKEIAELVAKDEKGELQFEGLGSVKVRPPARSAVQRRGHKR